MLIKPYNSIFTNKLDAYEQTYEGEVIDNNDPEKLKRIKVHIPIWDMYTDEQLQWVSPASTNSASPDSDNHNIPEIGSKVTISFNNKDPEDPQYSGASVTESTKSSIFDEDYPNTYGQKDSIGNFVMHNKNTGISVFHHNSGTEVQMDPDGSFLVQSGNNGSYISMDTKGNVKISAPTVTVVAEEEINMAANRINIHGKNILKMWSKIIEVGSDGTDTLTLTANYSNIVGKQCTLEPTEVKVENTLNVASAASYNFDDLFGKTTMVFANGVFVSKKSMV